MFSLAVGNRRTPIAGDEIKEDMWVKERRMRSKGRSCKLMAVACVCSQATGE